VIKKYNIFIKYTISAGISFAIDLLLFSLFNYFFGYIGDVSILLSTVLARVISSFFNYIINKNKVFCNNRKNMYDKKSLLQYYSLVVIQLCVSALTVFIIHKILPINATFIKIPVDIAIFITNYFIQKNIIFKESKK
jgi:putative flippase GtrA